MLRAKGELTKVKYLDKKYLNIKRWNSYYMQLELVRSLKAKSALEIGPGNGILNLLLTRSGIEAKTLDLDPKVQADWHGDVREIASIVPCRSFDCVLGFQILEHVPWEDFHHALCGIKEVTKRWAVISVPYSGLLIMPLLRLGRRGFREWQFGVRIPGFWRSNKYYKECGHQWECGAAGYNLRKVRNTVASVFNIVTEEYHPTDKSQIFWLLEKNVERAIT